MGKVLKVFLSVLMLSMVATECSKQAFAKDSDATIETRVMVEEILLEDRWQGNGESGSVALVVKALTDGKQIISINYWIDNQLKSPYYLNDSDIFKVSRLSNGGIRVYKRVGILKKNSDIQYAKEFAINVYP